MAFAQNCSGENYIDETLPTGSRWEMCWEHRAQEGIVWADVYFTTADGLRRRVLKEAALAQIHVVFDDNSARLNQLTDEGAGLGGSNIKDLDADECPDGSLLTDGSKSVICQQAIGRGYVYKSYNRKKQGYVLSLFSISSIANSAYKVRWYFFDDGTIEPSIGLSGHLPATGNDSQYGWTLDAGNTVGVAFTNNYYWRMDFDIGGNSNNDVVEEIEVVPSSDRSRKTISVTRLSSETGRNFGPAKKRSWRIRDASTENADGHLVSYHVDPLHTGHGYTGTDNEPWSMHDFYITRYKSCERFASSNPSIGGCGTGLHEFVDGESINVEDVVLWYRVTRHVLPRAEDRAIMSIRWDGFQVIPRDWTATNPLVL